MKLSEFTINSIKEFFTGDNNFTPYLSGPKLIALFNSVGLRDMYDKGLPDGMSRNEYVQTRLKEINSTKQIIEVIQLLFDERHFLMDPTKDLAIAVDKFNGLIRPDGYKVELIAGMYKIIGSDLPDEVEIEIYFEEIEKEILDQINSAKFSIWVAVAWFTNPLLMRALYEKQQKGVNVRLIVFDDEINTNNGFEYEKYFETKRVKPLGQYKNIMHHKFCIIDLKTVIHGSYNWTKKANWNKETISIDVSRDLAEKFAMEFISLIQIEQS